MIATMLITFIFFACLVGGALFAIKKIKETQPKNSSGTSSAQNSGDSVFDFLPFKDIKDGIIDIGGHQYRAVIECSSVNYNLKTEREKEVIEASFQRFLNSLSHPIWFFIQTRVIDNTRMIERLKTELQDAVTLTPGLEEYANHYYSNMRELNNRIGNNKQKKKYIIIPYGDANGMENLSDEEKYEYSKDELRQRASIIMSGLSTIGIKCQLLSNRELVELVHSSFHKDNYSDAEYISNGDFTTLMVQGKNVEQSLYDEARLDIIIYEAQSRIMNELVSKVEIPEVKEEFEQAVRDLNALRDKYGAYYKSGRK